MIEESFFLADARGPQATSQVVLGGVMGEASEVRIVWNIERKGETGGSGVLVDPNDSEPQEVDPDDSGPQAADPNDSGPQAVDPNDAGPQPVDLNDAGPQAADPNDAGPAAA